ncbi:hypothetical protein [Vulcanisaeta distributa]|uniref:Uncharacterized protein n=1 Tax=Vulcanisaeta distributa (strain DSM 14429 / JCM 11212 / NBRC 100878 / IC-017) TaxID=572478 RepID=E1QQB1_VULDI|nr:hypothetical protein [Vulcanisaeta distributa]ADN51598.1 hypothetical protein Vdis_2230 [Vulcanisaeta distributa DSM 14429]
MSRFRKLSLTRVKGLVIAVAVINGERHILMNNEAYEVVKEVNRLLGLRRCSVCGRWVRPEDLGYVEIMGNKVTKAVCQECLGRVYSDIAELMGQCLTK